MERKEAMEFDELLSLPPYSLDREEKGRVLGERLGELTKRHRECCGEYREVLDLLGGGFFPDWEDEADIPGGAISSSSGMPIPFWGTGWAGGWRFISPPPTCR